IFSLKDLPFYIGMVTTIGMWLRNRITVVQLGFVCVLVAYMAANYILINPSYSDPLPNIRQFAAPCLILIFLCSLRLDVYDCVIVNKTLYKVLLLIFCFGVIELIGGIWEKVDLRTFFGLKGIPVDGAGLSYMFYAPILG